MKLSDLTIDIIDYGMGNVGSIQNAFSLLGVRTQLHLTPKTVLKSRGLILPGVGAFGKAMHEIENRGWKDFLKHVQEEKRPKCLGICLGMQLMAESSKEGGHFTWLGLVAGTVIPLRTSLQQYRVPHVGWNEIEVARTHGLLDRIDSGTNFYFDHSFFVDCQSKHVTSYVEYGQKIAASFEVDNFYGVQFHPEKSQWLGLRILKNFSKLCTDEVLC